MVTGASRSAKDIGLGKRLSWNEIKAVSLSKGVGRARIKFRLYGRKLKKRDFRRLWIVRINAVCRLNDMKYSQLIHGLSLAGIELDRKSLADIAVKQPETFAAIAGQARDAIGKQAQAAA